MGFFSRKKPTNTTAVKDEKVSFTVKDEPAVVLNEGIDPEVVAVITAAIQAMMGTSTNFTVRNIVRVNDTTPIWARVARRDVMASRF